MTTAPQYLAISPSKDGFDLEDFSDLLVNVNIPQDIPAISLEFRSDDRVKKMLFDIFHSDINTLVYGAEGNSPGKQKLVCRFHSPEDMTSPTKHQLLIFISLDRIGDIETSTF